VLLYENKLLVDTGWDSVCLGTTLAKLNAGAGCEAGGGFAFEGGLYSFYLEADACTTSGALNWEALGAGCASGAKGYYPVLLKLN
jgi:hypothetical protein